AKPSRSLKKKTSTIPVTSGSSAREVQLRPPSVVLTNTAGPPQRPTATTVLGVTTRMTHRPITVAPDMRVEMFDQVRPPSVVSIRGVWGRRLPAVVLRLPIQPRVVDEKPRQRFTIVRPESVSCASCCHVAPPSEVRWTSPRPLISHPLAASRKNVSSCRPLGGLEGDPASIIQPSGPLTGAGVGAAAEGDAAGAAGED